MSKAEVWYFNVKTELSSLLYSTFYYKNQYFSYRYAVSPLASTLSKYLPPATSFSLCRLLLFGIIKFTVWMFFVAHFSILFSFKANKFFEHYLFRILSLFLFTGHLTIFIMPAVITEKSCHVSNQSQREILPDVTYVI